MASKAAVPKKVRLACRRCRTRRIKCDGQVPACSNCAKAGEVCIDVDSQNADVLIPRNFAGAAKARIKWLEDIIRERLPDCDLTAGPQVDIPSEAVTGSTGLSAEDASSDPIAESTNIPRPSSAYSQPERPLSRKRTADEQNVTESEDSFPEGARSVAFNLGMLSLNSDSSQKHYLGSSSGVLFANIIGASPSSDASGSTPARQPVGPLQDRHQIQVMQNNWQTRYWTWHQLLRQELPTHDDALLLLQTFLREVHPDYPVLEPISLFSALEALYECLTCSLDNDPLTHGWPRSLRDFQWNGQVVRPSAPTPDDVPMPTVAFIFLMIFNVASIVKVRARVYEYSPEKFYRAALLFSGDSFSRTSMSSIQALVMLMVHSLLTPADMHLWTLVHIAMAHCVELGIHREPSQITEEDVALQQIRKFNFYVIYSLDRSISTIQGRPLGLRDEAFDVCMPSIVQHSNSTSSNPFLSPSFQSDVTTYAVHQFSLDRIVSDIKTYLYHLPIESMQFPWPQNPAEHQTRIAAALNTWWDEASRSLSTLHRLDSYHKQVWNVKMKIKYHTTMVLLFQPSQAARHPSDNSLSTCFSSACAILQNYQLLQDWRCLQYDWRAVQNIFAAGATIVYTFWSSKLVQRSSSIIDLSKALRSCSSLLSVGGEWWPSVRIGKTSFETVVDLTIRKMYTNGTASKAPRLAMHRQADLNASGVDASPPRPQQHNSSGNSFSKDNVSFGLIGQDNSPSHSHLGPLQQQSHNDGLVTDLPAFDLMQHGYNQYSNPSPEARSTMGMLPEVEDFLADFDNSDFSWNMPLHGFDEQIDFGAYFVG